MIMTHINAYLNFKGNCREAMTFYSECLGGELTVQTIGGSPLESQCPSAQKDDVLHSCLTKGSLMLMGSDMEGPEGFTQGNNISLSVNCSSEEEINSFFNNLSEGGKIIHPISTQFWGAMFGVLNDKFGIRWLFNYDKNQHS
jgi:PhnB protein